MKEKLGQRLGVGTGEALYLRWVFLLYIYSDPWQEFKCPMATIRGQISEAGGLSSVTLSPDPGWTRRLQYYTIVGLAGDGASGIQKGGALDPGEGGAKPRGKDARSESEQGHRAPVEEGWSGQEQGLPPKGPSPQPPARVWQCTPGPCHASIHMEVLKAATPGAVTVWARDSGRKDPEKGGQQPLGPLQDALSPAQPSGR